MLGHGSGTQAEDHGVAGSERLIARALDEMPPRSLDQRFRARRLGQVAAVWGRLLRRAPIQLSIHTTQEPQAVTADAFCRGLMMIRSAEPGARDRDNVICGHSKTPRSWLYSS